MASLEKNLKQLQRLIVPQKVGGSHKNIQKNLLKITKEMHGNGQLKKVLQYTPEEIEELLAENAKLKEKVTKQEKLIEALEEDTKTPYKKRDIEKYVILNFRKFFRTHDGKLIQSGEKYDTNYYKYHHDDYVSAYERNRNNKKYFEFAKHQTKFIESWTDSAQEMTILYYGVGSGKTLIAVNCAEQFSELTQNPHVYFIVPSSLILNTIAECYFAGIDPERTNPDGSYIYNFISYQQLLRANFDFKENALLIIDEAHNLRNIQTKDITEKISARKRQKTGNFTLIGTKLSELLITSSAKFLRRLFMTGTLFVNSPTDIESIMSIGFNKAPLITLQEEKYNTIIANPKQFKTYYEGLISYFQVDFNDPRYPKKNFFVKLLDGGVRVPVPIRKDPYYAKSRKTAQKEKQEWIINFIRKHKKEKTLIYSQFLTPVHTLQKMIEREGVKCGIVSGELGQVSKMDVVRQYNENQITCLIFTLSIKEGISFKETNNIIIHEPYWNWAIMEQILARGIRLNSHKKGNKSDINLYFLVGTTNKNDSFNKTWATKAQEVLNNDIKTLLFPVKKVNNGKEEVNIKEKGSFSLSSSIDIHIFNKMINKQEEINDFEIKLKKVPDFEHVNNVENNAFVQWIVDKKKEYEEKNKKPMTRRQELLLKKAEYKNFYNETIKKTSQRLSKIMNFNRFSDMDNFQKNRNPDLVGKLDQTDKDDKTEQIKKLVQKGASLEEMFKVFGVEKKTITQLQANFTPVNHIQTIINESGIKEDKRDKILILEPTAGIGGVISQLLTLPNVSNFFIDCNEAYNLFYQIGMSIFNNIDNVHWYNNDFMMFENKYQYDYILGNPPFNISYQQSRRVPIIDKDTKKIIDYHTKKIDVHFRDVHFVAQAYNVLSTGGKLSMIISDKYKTLKSKEMDIFNEYIKDLKKHNAFKEVVIKGGFKTDKGVAESQKTNWGMICITMTKLENYVMDLNKVKRINNLLKMDNLYGDIVEEEKDTQKKITQDIKIEDKPIVEKKKSITEKAVIDNYIKPRQTVQDSFKKMPKQQQKEVIVKIQESVAKNKLPDVEVKNNKVKVIERGNRKVGFGIKVGKAIKVGNLQKFIEATYKEVTPQTIEGYSLDKGLSTKYTKVYWNDGLKTGIVSERATHDAKDILTDLYAGVFGKYLNKHPRFKQSWGTYDKIQNNYGSLNNWILIGYSLGAIVAEHYPKALQFKEIFLISKPVLPVDIFNHRKPLKNSTEIRSKLDATSILKPLQEKADREIVVKNDTMNPLREHQQAHFLPKLGLDTEVGDPNVKSGVGVNQKMLKKMKNSELKTFINLLSKAKKQKRPLIGGRKRKELQSLILEMSR